MKKTPMQTAKETFGDKKSLVSAIEKLTGDALWVKRTNEGKGLARVSNAKLLKLHATFTAVKEKFGTRDALIDAVVAAEGASKDATYRAGIADWPVPRLYDRYLSVSKRKAASDKTAKKAEAKPVAKKAAAKKTEAKPAAKKAAKKD